MAKERRRAVLELLQRPGNARCADCGAPDPDWASYTLGVFICLSCSGIHRNIPQVSKVKSVRLDAWEEAQVEFMASHGNDAARDAYESKVPPFYYRPTSSDCQLLREQWIRAKYERLEFTHPEKQEPYSAGYREGSLWKRGRDNGQFLSRKFVLTEREGSLKYFNRNDAKEPKAVMKIEHLNATFQPAKIGHPHGLQITYLKDNSTRNIFVYHEDGKLVPKLSRNYLKEGYMEKTGPKQTEGFRKRWFTMDDRRLMYFKDPLDAFARGEVFIGSRESGYTVLDGLPPSTQGHHWPHGITIVTPERRFLLACETESEQRAWMEAFRKVVDRPCCPRSTQWKPTSSINPNKSWSWRPRELDSRETPPKSQQPEGAGDGGQASWPPPSGAALDVARRGLCSSH
ncbi:arf-GAP with dual PH domain-containing protein 1 isoform X2 [Panthera pardus]|uniref:Arf-GAP with dual PH domain-containing protein 1 isoform X2 n=1 Tax=Panthera pardus TaxID=9691 RepID=A0A9V1EBC3_PANPR|nr:arf-GAP with dual PH domain-containing protein 1 isoform X2 [Panthera pardus]